MFILPRKKPDMRFILLLLGLSTSLMTAAQSRFMEVTRSELMGKFEPADHPGFVELEGRYATRGGTYLRREAAEAFRRMAEAARRDGIILQVVSGTRNYAYQVDIWNRKYQSFDGSRERRVEKVLLYSSMPGTSRHHWGTDVDINTVEPEYFDSSEGGRVYRWLQANAHQYGFYQPYTSNDEDRPEGYKEEKWHWSYLPQAEIFLRAFNRVVDYEDIEGFEGSELAKENKVLENFVNGIDPKLLYTFPL